MISKRVIFGAFLILVSSNFLYFGGVFNKTIIPFALVGYQIGYSQRDPQFTISYPTRTHRIIVKYTTVHPNHTVSLSEKCILFSGFLAFLEVKVFGKVLI